MCLLKWLGAMVLFTFANVINAGEFNNYCTTGLAAGSFTKSDCVINTLVDGKTYCFSTSDAKKAFDTSSNKLEIIHTAAKFNAANRESAREKISQEQADKEILSKACDFSNKDLGYLKFENKNLSHCNMENISLFGADLRNANLSGANLKGAYLNLARLENANLSQANLTDAIIFQAIFDKTNFQGANLTNARMIGTLGAVNMSDATILRGRFGLDMGNQPMGQMKFDTVGGKFANANFEGADLNIASFLFADLKGANLRNTNLFRGDLSKAELTGADLTNANLTDAIVDGTIMKDVKGMDSVKGWNTVKGKCENCKQ